MPQLENHCPGAMPYPVPERATGRKPVPLRSPGRVSGGHFPESGACDGTGAEQHREGGGQQDGATEANGEVVSDPTAVSRVGVRSPGQD